uniref:Peptidase S1 domain-containing protein n=1 Tax=Romanomermis culicivorax TaxID=13658 RepID=A0A915JBZ1_ROMCU
MVLPPGLPFCSSWQTPTSSYSDRIRTDATKEHIKQEILCNSKEWILPPDQDDGSQVEIIYGTSYIRDDGTDTFVRAAQVENHPRYKDIMNGFDISLVMLAERLPLEPGRVEPIELAAGPPPDGRFCRISGFGYTKPGTEIMSRQLQSAENAIMDTDLCAAQWPNGSYGPTASLIMMGLIFCSQTNRYVSRTCRFYRYNIDRIESKVGEARCN